MDTVPIWNSRRRSYLLIFTILALLCMLLISSGLVASKLALTATMIVFNLSLASCDILADALMVV